MWVERIGQPALTPWQLAFGGDVLIILRRTLAAAAPDEGCALLLLPVLPSLGSLPLLLRLLSWLHRGLLDCIG